MRWVCDLSAFLPRWLSSRRLGVRDLVPLSGSGWLVWQLVCARCLGAASGIAGSAQGNTSLFSVAFSPSISHLSCLFEAASGVKHSQSYSRQREWGVGTQTRWKRKAHCCPLHSSRLPLRPPLFGRKRRSVNPNRVASGLFWHLLLMCLVLTLCLLKHTDVHWARLM